MAFEFMSWESEPDYPPHTHECKGCGTEVEHEPDTSYYARRPDDCQSDNDILCEGCKKDAATDGN